MNTWKGIRLLGCIAVMLTILVAGVGEKLWWGDPNAYYNTWVWDEMVNPFWRLETEYDPSHYRGFTDRRGSPFFNEEREEAKRRSLLYCILGMLVIGLFAPVVPQIGTWISPRNGDKS